MSAIVAPHDGPLQPDPSINASVPATASPSASPTFSKIPSPAPAPAAATLAALLATALADVESLREELAVTRSRADRAERLLATFGDISASLAPQTNGDAPDAIPDAPESNPSPHSNPPLPPATVALLLALDERTVLAERTRDEATARLAALASNWAQLDAYLQVVEARAVDARAGFSRIVKEGGGGGKLVLLDVPMPGGSGYEASGSRQQRPLSYYDAAPAHVQRTSHHDRRFSGLPLPPLPPPASGAQERNSHGKRPRAESIDAHAYVIKKPREGEYDYASSHPPYRSSSTNTTYPIVQHASSSSSRHPQHSQSLPHYPPAPERQHTLPQPHARSRSRSGASDDLDQMIIETTNPSPGPRRDSLTVGGPERSNSMAVVYSPSANTTLSRKPTGPLVAPSTPFPATNAANQRICRQCGMPGRYKDGKCVEKWGPGPLGPGTVCDRCRKKMKRVERRGTLEAQAQAQAGMAQPPGLVKREGTGQGLARTDTLPNSSPYREQPQKESSIRSSLVATPSRSLTVAGTNPMAILPPLGGVRTHSPIPMHLDGEGEDDADADGDGDVDAEADELDDDADGEADLLEAVHAAESGHRTRHVDEDDD